MSDLENETYQVIFNTQVGTNILTPVATAANRAVVSYDINWEAIIPRGTYNKFKCRFSFKTLVYTGVGNNGLLEHNGFVNMNLGRLNIYDGMQQSQNIGMVSPVITNTVAAQQRSYYNCDSSDNNEFVIDYPINHIITISLNNFNGTALPNLQHYVLILSLTRINV